jgi:hypothetical protein
MDDFVFEVDVTAVVRVLAPDESAARKAVLTVIRTPSAAQIKSANETDAFSANATIFEVDVVVDAVERIERARPKRTQIATNENFHAPWSRADVFFLIDAHERGMSLADIAAFLGRTEDEVREKSKIIARKEPPAAPHGE